MHRLIVAALVLLTAFPVHAARKKKVEKPLTEEQKTLYAIGLVMARQVEVFDLTPSELKMVKRGFNDATKGRKPKVDFAVYSKKSQQLSVERREAHGKKLEAKSAAFLEAAANEEGAVKSASGVVYRSLMEGEGDRPVDTDTIRLHYRSLLIDNKEMDNTYKRGEPEEAKVNEYIQCIHEGVKMMRPGGKARLVCPAETALGKDGSWVVPTNSTLIYELELVAVVGKEKGGKDSQPVQGK